METREDSNTEVLDSIDKFLSDISALTLVEANKVQDFALDLRLLLSKPSVN